MKEKKIEEMVKVIEMTEEKKMRSHCDLPSPEEYANDLYNAGYRKQIEGEWIRDTSSKFFHRYNCAACNYRLIDEPTNYCPNCGAKIKGGAKMKGGAE